MFYALCVLHVLFVHYALDVVRFVQFYFLVCVERIGLCGVSSRKGHSAPYPRGAPSPCAQSVAHSVQLRLYAGQS